MLILHRSQISFKLMVEKTYKNMIIHQPFDPNTVRIQRRASVMIQEIVEKLENQLLSLDRPYQKSKLDGWDTTLQSRLIESILLDIPLPSFYFEIVPNEDKNSKIATKWRILDGLQRIITIRDFIINKNIALQNLEYLKQLEGKTYDDLSIPLQRRIKVFRVSINIIKTGTPQAVSYNIFRRLNPSAQKIKQAK